MPGPITVPSAGSFSSSRGNWTRRFPIGAEPCGDGTTHIRVWAPRCRSVEVLIDSKSAEPHALEAEAGGYFSGVVPAGVRARYWFQLDEKGNLHCDPASRFQPQGPGGPSQVVDPTRFGWTDDRWRGVKAEGQVIYEMHIGTFTRQGTWAAAAEELSELARIGISCIEVMPVSDFPGSFGWGYDGVNLFAPTRLYGDPDDFRRFVDRAHSVGMGVILDVVYNHVGPQENCLTQFSEDYLTDRHKNDWGRSINFDGNSNAPVREFYLTNARYWVSEFHLDGFRFDATQAILDDSPRHILAELSAAIRDAAGVRSTLLVAENEPQHTIIVRPPERGGYGLDALWNDDFHHSASVALTGRHEAYYSDHRGKPQEFVSAAKWGYLFQGQKYCWQSKRRGTPAIDLPPYAFVNFIENHDQVANSATGQRMHQIASAAQHRAITALLLLSPQTPMLFQGQEFSASSPFLYFADFKGELRDAVRKGRHESLQQFPSIAGPKMQGALDDPADEQTFLRSKLDLSERQKHAGTYRLHEDLLRLRRDEPALRQRWPGGFDGAVLSEGSFILRYFSQNGDDRVLIFNLGADDLLNPAPEPLLAPPIGKEWEMAWHSEDPAYGGTGVIALKDGGPTRLQAHSAMMLRPIAESKKFITAPVSNA